MNAVKLGEQLKSRGGLSERRNAGISWLGWTMHLSLLFHLGFSLATVSAISPNPVNPGVVSVAGNCLIPGNAPPNSSCLVLNVQCPNVADVLVDVRIHPTPIGIQRGTVVLGSGGEGTGFQSALLSGGLNNLGFTTVNRAWRTAWHTGPGGLLAASCRYAALLFWVDEQISTSEEPLCATGNSAGAAEIAYALSHWQAGDILSLAIPTGGPPLSRPDLGCAATLLYDDGEPWSEACQKIVPDFACLGRPVSCFNSAGLVDLAYPGLNACSAQNPIFASTLRSDSILSNTSFPELFYPNTLVHAIDGFSDCTGAVPLGILWVNSILSVKRLEWVDAPHVVESSVDGRNAVLAAVDANCR